LVLVNLNINIHVLKSRVIFWQSELLSVVQEWYLPFKHLISHVSIMWESISQVINRVLEKEDWCFLKVTEKL
jgi:hypothetical protein